MGRPAVTSTANRTSTSRLIVKGLAPKTDTAALRATFSRYGTLTDARVLATADGRSRQFGFVGFDDPGAAAAARAGLNRTYLGAARLAVEYARAVGDDAIPRPWSRYSVGSSRYTSKHGGGGGGGGDDKGDGGDGTDEAGVAAGDGGAAGTAADAKLAEFKAVMQKRSRKPLWADGAAVAAAPGGRRGEGVAKRKRAEVALDASTLKRYELAPGADAGETGRIFVRNLAFSVTEDDLDTLFSRHGTLAEVHLVVDPDTRRSRGIAYILYVLPECAVAALAALDGEIFAGRILHLLPAAGRPPPLEARHGGSGGGASAYQAAAASARVASAVAGTDVSAGRSALYVDSHAVARATAERLGVSTAEVLADDGYAAVRLAAGEARLQADARAALAAAGVDVAALTAGAGGGRAGGGGAGRGRRSRATLLAKNLPAGTTAEALEALFSPHGLLTGVVVAPGGVLAVVQFGSAGDAKAAHAELAYSRIGDRPLYLEWAPAAAVAGFGVAAAKRLREENLNFTTTDDALRAHFERRPRAEGPGDPHVVCSATVARKRVAERRAQAAAPGAPRPSMGYGFVAFPDRAAAVAAVARLQRSRLDGHALELKLSTRGADAVAAAAACDLVTPTASRGGAAAVAAGGGGGSAKLVVKNVAFGATAKEIRALFASFASVKGVRLPRGGDGRPKGYAFVELASASEAAAARTTLADAHLYGRHLVLEAARDEAVGASVDALQALAAGKERRRGRPKAGAGGGGRTAARGGSSSEDDEADEHEMMLDSLYT
ncbi:hypothetical protein I4F81_000158 [Pyropia yezoensis]|uniref:Uncharacterized protein n=1 Tax=Pyropia yezoensis TaxID=2788 RepID=A0ACC3BJ65_PYRYE|nr:hypothetical protein I4F81_000158 [Neopyropia yezoensis]